MKRTLYFVRHGETDWNRQNRWQGQTDIPLNDLGRAQARTVGGLLSGLNIARIESSDLSRAAETAAIVSAALDQSVRGHHADLRERCFGVFEGLTRDECETHYPDDWRLYREDHRIMPPGAERQEHLLRRMTEAVDRLAGMREDTGAPLLLVGHGGAIRSLLSFAQAAPLPPIPNGGIFRCVWSGSGASLTEIALIAAP